MGDAVQQDAVLVERRGHIAIVRLNREESRNALQPAIKAGLQTHIPALMADPAVRALVLTGTGKAFCAGGDIRDMQERGGPAIRARLQRSHSWAERLLAGEKPVIAAVNGAAAGAGLSLALACDLRIAVRSAKITTAFAKVALSGDFGGTYFLTRLVGSAKARELYFTSPVLTADDALRLGLVNEVVDDAEFAEAARAYALKLAHGPRVTLGYIKHNINMAETASLEACFDNEAINHVRSGGTADHREAAAAFVEKRQPVFRGA